jgi:hypothetical protein
MFYSKMSENHKRIKINCMATNYRKKGTIISSQMHKTDIEQKNHFKEQLYISNKLFIDFKNSSIHCIHV